MTLTHVASSAWVTSTGTVTPTVPTGTAAGDLVVITLASKYDDAVLVTFPTGWTDLGAAANTGRSTGVDSGNMRCRAFYKVWQAGDTMPTLDPTPNNVSTVKATTWRKTLANWDVNGEIVVDNITGSPLEFTASSTLGLAAGDQLQVDMVLNGDVATWLTTTISATGATFGTMSTSAADASSTSGTDIRMRSVYRPVTSGTATAAPLVSTPLGAATTNTVGVGLMLRIREVSGAPATQTMSPSGIATGEAWPSGGGGGGVPTIDATTFSSATASPVVGTLPSGTGDFLVAFVGVDNENPVTATGWTVQGYTGASAATPADSSITCLTAPASVGSFSFAYSTDAARFAWCVIYRVSGAAGVHAENQIPAAVTYTNTTSTTRAIPQVTTTVANCLVLNGVVGDSASGANYTWPAGWTEDRDLNDATTGMTMGTATSTQASAGTTTGGNITIVAAGEHMSTITLALEPTAGGGGGGPTVSQTVASTNLSPTAIATAYASGTATATLASGGSQTLTPTGISSAESFAGGGNVTPGLPGIIDGIEPEAQGGFAGPVYDSNGNIYRITEQRIGDALGLGNHVQVMKSSDGGVTWAVQDETNIPGYADGASGTYNDLESAWLLQNASAKQIYPIWCKAQSRWFSATFNTSDHPTAPDQFVTAETPGTGGWDTFSTTANESGISGAVLSNGDLQAFVRGTPQSSLEAFKWRKRVGTTWVDKGYITDSVGMSRPQAVVGESDKVYLFYRGLGGTVRYRTVASNDTVSASAQISASAGASDTKYMNNCLPPVYYDAGGTPVVTVAYVNGSDQLKTNEVRGGTVGSEITVSTDTLVVDPLNDVGAGTDNQGPSAALVAVGTTLYAFWGTGTVVKYATKADGGSWSAATTYVNLGVGHEAQWIYANKFTRSGSTLIGLTYDDGPHGDDDSNITYNELLVSGGGGTTVTQTAATYTASPTAIASAEAFGTAAAVGKISLAPLAIASVEALGSPTIASGLTLSPTAIASAEAFGNGSALGKITSSPTAIASAEALGAPSVGAVVTLSPSGTATAEAVGSPTASTGGGGGPATPSLVGQNTAEFASATGGTISYASTAGNLLVIMVSRSGGQGTGQLTGVTDSAGQTWSIATRGSVTGQSNTRLEVWYKENSAAVTSVTFSSGTSQTSSVNVSEWANMATSSFDVASPDNSGVTSSSTTITTPSITTTADNDLVLAAFSAGTATPTQTSGWTDLSPFDYTGARTARGAYTVGAIGSYSATWTLSTAKVAGITTVSFKPTVLAGGGTQTMSPTAIGSAEAFGSVTAAAVITMSPTAISSAEAVGTPALSGQVTMSPAGVASAVAFGTTVLSAKISLVAQGIASAEAFGSPSLASVISLTPLGGTTGESFGQPSVSAVVSSVPVGIATAQALGNPTLSMVVTASPVGLASAEAVGTPSILGSNSVQPTGISSAEAFGAATALGKIACTAVGIATAEAVGVPTLSVYIALSPTGIATGQALGTPSLSMVVTATATGIASAEAVGSPSVLSLNTVAPTGIASAQAFGTAVVTTKVTLTATGIASAEAVGTPTLAAGLTLSPIAVSSAEAVGSPLVTNVVALFPLGIGSTEAVGTPTLSPRLSVGPAAVVSAEAFGSPVLGAGLTASPVGVPTAETLGVPSVTSRVTAQPAPVASVEAFGTPTLGNVNSVAPLGIASAQAMGTPTLSAKTTMTPVGVASAQAFGLPNALGKIGLAPTGIPTQQAVGTPTLQSITTALAEGLPSQEAWGAPVLALGPPVVYTPATEPDAYFSYEDDGSAEFGRGDGGAAFPFADGDTSLRGDTTTTTMEA